MRAFSLTSVLTVAAGAALFGSDWPSWRGPSNNGVSTETALPVTWGATCADAPAAPAAPPAEPSAAKPAAPGPARSWGGGEGRPLTPFNCDKLETQNVAWKLPLPAYSGSTPIIWGDTIFLNVATAANTGELELWAVDRSKQTVMWKRPLADTNHMERKQNMSSPSPVTDGQHVWVMTGVGLLKAFDFAGKELWSRNLQADYGKFGLNWGYASSPLLRGNALYVQVLHGMKTDDPSYVLKIDAKTGKTIWRVERPTERGQSRRTPTRRRRGWKPTAAPSSIITGGDVVIGPRSRPPAREYWRADVLNPQRDRQLPDRRVADDCRGLDHRPDPQQPDGGDAAGRQRRRGRQPCRLDVRAGTRRAHAGQRRQAALRRPRRRRRLRARRQDRRDGVRTGAAAAWHLQRVADPRRRQDLRHDRGRRHHDGLPRRARSSRFCRRTRWRATARRTA